MALVPLEASGKALIISFLALWVTAQALSEDGTISQERPLNCIDVTSKDQFHQEIRWKCREGQWSLLSFKIGYNYV